MQLKAEVQDLKFKKCFISVYNPTTTTPSSYLG